MSIRKNIEKTCQMNRNKDIKIIKKRYGDNMSDEQKQKNREAKK